MRRPWLLGLLLALVTVGIVVALFVESPVDAWFALSPDGPTRAGMALLATIALFGVVALGAPRTRLPIAAGTWRLLHAYLALW